MAIYCDALALFGVFLFWKYKESYLYFIIQIYIQHSFYLFFIIDGKFYFQYNLNKNTKVLFLELPYFIAIIIYRCCFVNKISHFLSRHFHKWKYPVLCRFYFYTRSLWNKRSENFIIFNRLVGRVFLGQTCFVLRLSLKISLEILESNSIKVQWLTEKKKNQENLGILFNK